MDFPRNTCRDRVVVSGFRWEVIVRVVDIGRIVDRDGLNFLLMK